jgi:hypothetical protein
MTKFEHAIELANRLPEAEREELGAMIIQELESEARWASSFEKSHDVLSDLADAALVEHRAGNTRPWP